MALIKCHECGKEISDKASSCPNCGCPIEHQEKEVENSISEGPVSQIQKEPDIKKSKKKVIPIVITVAVVVIVIAIIGIVNYNNKVLQPRKIEAQNKVTYEEAIGLLEKGKYEEGNKILQTIAGYNDVDTILEQIKWESRVYECITNLKKQLKNPDSLQIYEVNFYNGYKSNLSESKQTAMKELVKLSGGEPICVMYTGAQNGFGGNTTDYSLFLYSDGTYDYLGSCDSLDKDDIDKDDTGEQLICGMIDIYKDNLKSVGNVDLTRIKTILKNDSYSTIKIID